MTEHAAIHEGIIATLTYFDLFDTPLTLEELIDYFYGELPEPPHEILKALRTVSGVSYEEGFYFLKGRDEIVALRKKRKAYAAQLWKRVSRYQRIFPLCPFVKMAVVCNTLAYDNVTGASDIDIFVVAESGHLATARFFLKCLTQLFGVRVHHEKIAGRFCLSFFVDETAMNVNPLAHDFDPHLAYFVKLMMPIADQSTYKKFLEANNSWTSHYFKRPLEPRLHKIKHFPLADALRHVAEFLLKLLNVESFFYRSQHRKDLEQEKKIANHQKADHGKQDTNPSIFLGKTVFKFHEKDPRRTIAETFSQRLADQRRPGALKNS